MRTAFLRFALLAGALAAGACASPYVAVPLAVHPSATTGGPSMGASLGGVYGHAEESDLIAVPYSEAWLRLGAGAGQFHLHMGPGVAQAGYRFDLQPMTAGVGLAVEPFGGGGYYRISEIVIDGETGEDSQYTLVLAGGLRVHVLVPTGAGFFYVAPVIGITTLETNDELDSNDLMTLGTAVGLHLGGRPGTSVELTVHRASVTDDFDSELWMVGPSVGFQL
ncbi:MAG TPA: hypothetical protein VFU21_22030 [Kofleriaceae bacterium]|nr:hypothetical protein [Kofleriaceae bacterium]